MAGGSEGGDLPGGNPLDRRRILGAELRRLRLDLDLTAERAGAAIGRSGSWISRLESGKIGIRPRELHDLLDVYRVGSRPRRGALESLAVEGRQRSWWSSYREVIGESYSVFVGLEDSAASIFEYQERVVPGLFLQTESYMRALFARYVILGAPVWDAAHVDRLVEVRRRRQRILERRDPPSLSVVIDESVIHRLVGGPTVHRGQLSRLLECGRNGVDLRMVPFGWSGGPPSVPSFTLFETARADGAVVALEKKVNRLSFLEGASVAPYGVVAGQLREVALPPALTLQFIAGTLDELPVES